MINSKIQIVEENKYVHFFKFQIDQFEHETISTIPKHQSKKFRVFKMEPFEEIESLKQIVQNQKDSKSQKMEEQQVKIFGNLREKINGFEQNYFLETYSTRQKYRKIFSLIEEIQKSQKYLKNNDLYGLKIEFYNILERSNDVKKTIEDSKNNLGYFDDHFLKLNTNAKIHLEHKNYMSALIPYLQILSIQRDLGLFYIGVCFQKMNWNYSSIKCFEKACEIRKDPLYYLKLCEGYNRLRSLNSSDLQEEEKQKNQKLINLVFKIISGEKINIQQFSRITAINLKNIFQEKDELNILQQLSNNKILNKKAKFILLDLSQNYPFDKSTSTKDTEISKFLQVNDIDQLYQNTKTQFKQSLKQSYSWKTFSHFSLQEKSYKQLLLAFQFCFNELKSVKFEEVKKLHEKIHQLLEDLLDQLLQCYLLEKDQKSQTTYTRSYIDENIYQIEKQKENLQYEMYRNKEWQRLKIKIINMAKRISSIKNLQESLQLAKKDTQFTSDTYKLELSKEQHQTFSKQALQELENWNFKKFESQIKEKIEKQLFPLKDQVSENQNQCKNLKIIKQLSKINKATKDNLFIGGQIIDHKYYEFVKYEQKDSESQQVQKNKGKVFYQLTLFKKTIKFNQPSQIFNQMKIVDPGLELIDQESLSLHKKNCQNNNCESDNSLVMYFTQLNFFLLQTLISENPFKGKDFEELNKYVSFLTAFQSIKYKVNLGNMLPKTLKLISGDLFQEFLAQAPPKILLETQFEKIKTIFMQKYLDKKKVSFVQLNFEWKRKNLQEEEFQKSLGQLQKKDLFKGQSINQGFKNLKKGQLQQSLNQKLKEFKQGSAKQQFGLKLNSLKEESLKFFGLKLLGLKELSQWRHDDAEWTHFKGKFKDSQSSAKNSSFPKEIKLKGQFANLNSIYEKMLQMLQNEHLRINDLKEIFDLESLKPEIKISYGIVIVQFMEDIKEYYRKILISKIFNQKE